MRNHPAVMKIVHTQGLGYDDAETLLRGRKDPEAAAAVREIDIALAAERDRATALNSSMAERLGLKADRVADLVSRLVADPALETWLLRRVYLTRAGTAPAADEHPENQ